ncbi:hypothetical protein GIB67_003452 [Kingdonia uniflora]|uniref:RNase H type-1 domain-containing protein n=1 Tax=Kingdonia uniflora TaxID=39325 RepID=A0A7J7P9Z0_9MAGN|nr:hypothetical protein GIB67_016536 [Kingdonia uniflora]KAF6175964.1 hypothetical protein GIB67_003452 [Kingdonia uniflora]
MALALSWQSDKDAGYVENQQQNMSDAIDLLPYLATGIDVNFQFQSIIVSELMDLSNELIGTVKTTRRGGAILRDSSGQVLGSLMQGLGVVSNFLAECIVFGLTLTTEMGWKVAWLKSDPIAAVLSFK